MTQKDVLEIIKHDKRFTVLSEVLERSGIADALSRERNVFTFFAPTDDAFALMPKAALRLMKSPDGRDLTASVVGRHIVPGEYLYSYDLLQRGEVKPLHGTEVTIDQKENVLRFGKAAIRTPGIAARNGVVFPVDEILPLRQGGTWNA